MQKYTIEGFCFDSQEEYNKAYKESETIKYIRTRTDMNDKDAVYRIYNKLIDSNIFSTALGVTFLSNLRNLIIDQGGENDLIPCINVETQKVAAEQQDATPESNNVTEPDEKPPEVQNKESVPKNVQLIKNKLDNARTRIRNLRIIIGALFIMFVALFAIVLFSDVSPFTDAREQILDEYSAWEEELTFRERAVTEREKAIEALQQKIEEPVDSE